MAPIQVTRCASVLVRKTVLRRFPVDRLSADTTKSWVVASGDESTRTMTSCSSSSPRGVEKSEAKNRSLPSTSVPCSRCHRWGRGGARAI